MFLPTLLFSYIAKLILILIRVTRLGNGTTFAGLMVENYFPQMVAELVKNTDKVILITGTNGKTTTRSILVTIFEDNGIMVCSNRGGANIYRGVASALLFNWNWLGQPMAKTLILEVEEATMPKITKYIKPDQIIITNIFRDQLDAYGEINQTLAYFRTAIEQTDAEIIINADDHKLLSIVSGADLSNRKISGFSVQDKDIKMLDFEKTSTKYKIPFYNSITATNIHTKNFQNNIYITWSEKNQGSYHILVKSNLMGTYNVYNTLAALNATLPQLGKNAFKSIEKTQPVFGRGEKIIYRNKEIWLFLVKNPVGMNQVCDLINDNFGNENLKVNILINDKIADGRDVSWLWDCKIEEMIQLHPQFEFSTAGRRGLDMLLRLEMAGADVKPEYNYETITKLLEKRIYKINLNPEKHIILATYTAMLEVRRALAERVELPNMNSKGN